MANLSRSLRVPAAAPRATARPSGGLGFDLVMALLGLWLMGGLYLDGWAHEHVPDLETFFTPWHGVLYSGFAAIAGALGLTMLRSRLRGAGWRQLLPDGYGLTLLGAALFMFGGVFDLVWHELFGIEESVDALLSPSHLLLALSGTLMVGGPLRAAWRRGDAPGPSRLSAQLPMLISLLLLSAILSFFTQFANPIHDQLALEPLRREGMPLDIYSMRADGRMQTRLTSNTSGYVYYPDISPDGRRIAFTTSTHAGPLVEVMQSDGSGRHPLTEPDSWYPAWSPDGRQIAYAAQRAGDPQIYLIGADGGGERQLTSGPGGADAPEWSPDGQRIAFVSERDGARAIYLLTLATGAQTRLTSSDLEAFQPAWSPDGRQLAFTSGGARHDEVYLIDAAGGEPRQLTSGEHGSWAPTWFGDGKSVVVTSYDPRQDSNELYRVGVSDGAMTPLANNPALEERGRTALSADGQTLVFAAGGHPWMSGSSNMGLGVAGILIYTAFMMGLLLLALRRWRLAPGAVALLLAGNVTMIALMEERYELIVLGLLVGLLGELLRWLLRPAPGRVRATRIFAAALPVLLYSCYFGALALQGPLSWKVHLWGGLIVVSGIVGLLLSYLLYPPQLPAAEMPASQGSRL